VASLYDVYYKAKEVDVSLRSSKRLEYEKVNQRKIENTTGDFKMNSLFYRLNS
jgi:hypothetical protein